MSFLFDSFALTVILSVFSSSYSFAQTSYLCACQCFYPDQPKVPAFIQTFSDRFALFQYCEGDLASCEARQQAQVCGPLQSVDVTKEELVGWLTDGLTLTAGNFRHLAIEQLGYCQSYAYSQLFGSRGEGLLKWFEAEKLNTLLVASCWPDGKIKAPEPGRERDPVLVRGPKTLQRQIKEEPLVKPLPVVRFDPNWFSKINGQVDPRAAASQAVVMTGFAVGVSAALITTWEFWGGVGLLTGTRTAFALPALAGPVGLSMTLNRALPKGLDLPSWVDCVFCGDPERQRKLIGLLKNEESQIANVARNHENYIRSYSALLTSMQGLLEKSGQGLRLTNDRELGAAVFTLWLKYFFIRDRILPFYHLKTDYSFFSWPPTWGVTADRDVHRYEALMALTEIKGASVDGLGRLSRDGFEKVMSWAQRSCDDRPTREDSDL